NLSEMVCESACRYGAAPALQAAGAGPEQYISYSRLAALIGSGSHFLRVRGLSPGDRILLYCEASPALPVTLFSILARGMVAVPIAAEMPPAIVAGIAEFADIRALVVSNRTRTLASLVSGRSCLDVEELLQGGDSSANIEPRPDLALLAFTSGSTSQPRAVE